MNDRHLLFFYGTLMSGHGRGNMLTGRQTNRGFIDLAQPVAVATIRGVMHDVAGGAFPGVVGGDSVVRGEVWECPSEAHLRAALGVTDSIEGYRGPGVAGNLYDRVEVPLQTVEQQRADCPLIEPGDTVLTYFYNADGRGFLGPVVPGGDWRTYEPSRGFDRWAMGVES